MITINLKSQNVAGVYKLNKMKFSAILIFVEKNCFSTTLEKTCLNHVGTCSNGGYHLIKQITH